MNRRNGTKGARTRFTLVVVLLSISACGGQPVLGDSELLVSTLHEGNWEVSILNLKESILFQTTRDPGIDIDPVWSPNTEEILIVSTRKGSEATTDPSGDEELFVVNREGSVVR